MDEQLLNIQNRPVFVGGASRSGTTIVTTALSKHSQIFGRNEMGWVNYFLSFLAQVNDSVSPKWSGIAIEHEELYRRLAGLMFQCSAEKYIVDSVFQQNDFKIWSGKVPTLLPDIDHLTKLYPQAKFILVVRNGVDVLNSVLSWNRQDYGFEQGCREWCNHARAAIEATERNNVLIVRHEKLVKDSRSFWQEIMEFIELPFEESLIEHCRIVTNSSFSPHGTSASPKEFNRKQARDNWTTAHKSLFEELCFETMSQLGYTNQ